MNRAREIIADCNRVVDSANDLAIEWYVERRIAEEVESLEALLEDDDSHEPAVYYDKLDFPDLVDRQTVLGLISDQIDARRDRLSREREARRRESSQRPLLASSLTEQHFRDMVYNPPVYPQPPNYALESQMMREREAIDVVVRDARHQIRTVNGYIDSIRGNPESSPQITWALFLVTILFFAGVIYPLSFMPFSPGGSFNISFMAFFELLQTLKGFLLLVVSFVFTSILVLFFRLNIYLRYPKALLQSFERFSRISTYSKHFEIMDRNQRAGAASHNNQ